MLSRGLAQFLHQGGNRRRLFRSACGVVVGLAVASAAIAAEDEAAEKDDGKVKESTPYSVSELGLDYDVPESPAFTILNLNPKDATHMTAPRDFAATILNGLDKNGHFQSGIAVDLNPWGIANRVGDEGRDESKCTWCKSPLMLTAEKEVDGVIRRNDGYIDGDFTPLDLFGAEKWSNALSTTRWLRYFWYRTSFSFATTRGAENDDESLRLAGGVHPTPWSLADPRYQVAVCVAGKVEQMNQVLGEIDDIANDHGVGKVDIDTTAADPSADPVSVEIRSHARDLRTFQKSERGKEFEEVRRTIQDKLRMKCVCRQKLCMPNDDGEVRRGPDRSVCAASTSLKLKGATDDSIRPRLANAVKWVDLYEQSKADIVAEECATALVPKLAQGEKGKATCPAAGAAVPADIAERAAYRVADRIVDACRDENKDNSNYSSWDIAVAPSWISQDGSAGGLRWNGWGIWTSLAIGPDFFATRPKQYEPPDRNRGSIGKSLQFFLHGRYRFDERAPVEDGTAAATTGGGGDMPFYDNDSWLVAARLQALFTDWLGASVEGAAINDNVSGTGSMTTGKRPRDDSYFRFALVPTFRVTDNVWVDVSIGSDVDRRNQNNSAFVLSSIKYGYSQSPWGARGSRKSLNP